MHIRMRAVVLMIPFVTAAVGCARRVESAGSATTAEYDTPPKISVGMGGGPQRMTIGVQRVSGGAGGPGPGASGKLSFGWDVLVDTLGRPDMATLHVTGRDAEVVRSQFNEIVREMRFEPARKDGRKVAAVYRQSAQ